MAAIWSQSLNVLKSDLYPTRVIAMWYRIHLMTGTVINSSPTGQNGRDFQEDIFRCIFEKKILYFD